MYQNFIIPYLYEAPHVSGDTPPIIRSLKLHWQPLVFHTWKVVGHVIGGRCQAQCAWQRPPTTRPTTFHVSYKYGIIKFWYIVTSCWIFLYEMYYDARIQEHQVYIASHRSMINIFAFCWYVNRWSEICWLIVKVHIYSTFLFIFRVHWHVLKHKDRTSKPFPRIKFSAV